MRTYGKRKRILIFPGETCNDAINFYWSFYGQMKTVWRIMIENCKISLYLLFTYFTIDMYVKKL